MKRYIVAVLSLLVLAGIANSGVRAEQIATTDQVFTRMFAGTIEGIDPMQQIVTVQSESKEEVRLLAFTDAEVVQGLTKGDRVVIELDEHGLAKKIVKTVPALGLVPDSSGN